MTLKTDIDQLAVDAGKLHDIVHGSPTDVVATDGGTVKSVAKAIADLEAQIVAEAGSYVDQCQDEVALATAQAQTATNQAAAAAGSALSAASVVAQDLSAIDRTVFASTTLVDAFLYDTSKDSDGGAWRKRCAHTSWENETLSGNWLGSAANEAAARALDGAVTGSLYYDTTAAGFYTLAAGSGKTAAYRGNTRQFPAQVLITVQAARVILWDLTQAGVPMWMVCPSGYNGGTARCASAINGLLVFGQSLSLPVFSFIDDQRYVHNGDTGRQAIVGDKRISARVSAIGSSFDGSGIALVNYTINDVAMTVLPNAPVDVATGLPVPTIDVFTDAGTSRINHNGTVADLADTAGDDHKAGCILASGDSVGLNSTSGNLDIYKLSNTLADTLTPDRTYDQGTTPALLEAVDAGDKVVAMRHRLAIGQDNGVNVLLENPASVAAGMIAYVTKDYNSGWQVGAIKGAWLADTVAEVITGTELVTNGMFATDITDWTDISSGTGSIAWDVAGRIAMNGVDGSNRAIATQSFATVVGKTYTVAAEKTSGTDTAYVRAGTSGNDNSLKDLAVNAVGRYVFSFVATTTTTYLSINSQGVATFDNISCRLADVDRSVKAKGLQVVGSLTKAPVASGAQLVCYSGFSAANYLEQPYNSDLDFGTGDLCIMGWIKEAPNSVSEYVFTRGDYNGSVWSGAAIRLHINSSGTLTFAITDDAFVTSDAMALALVDDSRWRFIGLIRRGNYLELWADGIKAAADVAITAAAGSLNNANAKTSIAGIGGQSPLTNGTLALWRAGATAPTAEQIRHIYEAERPLFEPSAQCCLAGTSNAVTALAYDDETDLLHVGTSYGRSAFKDLVRVASEATGVGAITALAAGAGIVAQAGASGADVYVPAYLLREELLRDAEQMARFGQNLIAHDFTATASQTTFALPVGWEIVAVYQQGTIKRETTSWTRSFDGFKWSAVLGTGATVSDWISILAKRV